MHTNSSPAVRPKHRHFLVAPVFALAVFASVLPLGQSTASLLPPASIPGSIAVPNALLIPDQDTLLDLAASPPALRQGTVLVDAHGLFQMQTPQALLSGLSGGFSLVLEGDALTVAAITSPVLVQTKQDQTVVPVGRQLRLTATTSLLGIEQGWQAWLDARSTDPLPVSYSAPLLQTIHTLDLATLPASDPKPTGPLMELQTTLTKGDRAAAAAALQQSDVLQVLAESPASAKQALSAFLHPDGIDALDRSLLQALLPSDQLWLLGAFHPAYRSLLWSLPSSGVDLEDRALALLLLPDADTLPEAAASSIPLSLPLLVSQLPVADTDRLSLTKVLIHHLIQASDEFQALLNPARSLEYRQVSKQLLANLPANSDPEIQAMTQSLQHSIMVDHPSSVSSSSVPASSSSSCAGKLDSDQALELARQFVDQLAVSKTVQTSMTLGGEPGTVHVDGIVAVLDGHDALLSFDVLPFCRTVIHIVSDGEPSPFSMTMDGFAKWVGEQ